MPDSGNPWHVGDFLTAETVLMNLKGRQRDEVLEELVEAVPSMSNDEPHRTRLLQALHEREQLCSTGVGDGVAFPHARNALVGLVQRPVVVFGRSLQGVPFGAVDGMPARLFFLVVAPNVTSHLRILARLSRLMRDPKVRQELLKAEHPSRVLSLIRVNEVNFDG